MLHYKAKFENFYKSFQQSDLFRDMVATVEGTMWHREENVGVHTNMVVAEYIKRSPKQWELVDFLGAVACAFHDTGKPEAQEAKHNEERGNYFTYKGHEQISTRIFENYALTNISELNLLTTKIAAVCWMIQNHLPYRIKKLHKLQALRATADFYGVHQVFQRMVLSDQYGRTSDRHNDNKFEIFEWLAKYNDVVVPVIDHLNQMHNKPTLFVLIGPSSAGKSTLTKELIKEQLYCDMSGVQIFCMDQCRLDWYTSDEEEYHSVADRYSHAFHVAYEDKQFTAKVQASYKHMLESQCPIIADNLNLTAKSRRHLCTEAMNKGYHVICIVLQVSKEEIVRRGRERNDRLIPEDRLINMHNRMTYPNILSECHNIIAR